MQLTSATYTWNAAKTFGLYIRKLISFSPPVPAELQRGRRWRSGRLAVPEWVLQLAGRRGVPTQGENDRSQFLQLLHCKEHQHCVSATPKPKKGQWKSKELGNGPRNELFWRQVLHTGAWENMGRTRCRERLRLPCLQSSEEYGDSFLIAMNLNGHTLSRMIQVCFNAKRCLG